MTARSSAHFATCGNSSLTHSPLSPCWANFHGDASTLPTLSNCVGSTLKNLPGGWPSYLVSSGLGSKGSTCDGPPSMYRKMTLRAVARWCRPERAGAAASASRVLKATAPKPEAQRVSRSRRVSMTTSTDEDKLFHVHQRMRQFLRPRLLQKRLAR